MSEALPVWAHQLRERYLAGEASVFVVHGNVRDLVPDGVGGLLDLPNWLAAFLGRSRDVVAAYDPSRGLHFPIDAAHGRRFLQAASARAALRGEPGLAVAPRPLRDVLAATEDVLTSPGLRAAFVLDHADLVLPRADAAFLGEDERSNLVRLLRWTDAPLLRATDSLVVLVCDALPELHPRLRASPQLAVVPVPYPDVDARHAFLAAHQLPGLTVSMSLERLAEVTAGLTLVQLRALLLGAVRSGEPLDFAAVNARKKEIIETECAGLVELITPSHTLADVGGLEGVKASLQRVADAIIAGETRRVPMGIGFVGPMGTGKTFVAEAFAASSGLTCLALRNVRDRWVGSSEANLEKVLGLVDALGYALLILDEAERLLAPGGAEDATNSRLIARLKTFLSDTRHRGRVVVLMMTNRPDKLEVDLKRPGRMDLKIPFFFPETDGERAAVLAAQFRRAGVAVGFDLGPLAAATAGRSAAELEQVVVAALAVSDDQGRDAPTAADAMAAAADTLPSRDTRRLRFMELLAVFEATSRGMLPPRYQAMSTDEVQDALAQLATALGEPPPG